MHQFFGTLGGGFAVLADPKLWILLAIGTVLGVIVGALPGIGATVTYGLVLPFTFLMSPVYAVAFLLSIAVGNQFGNSIPAILIGLPGSPSTILTVIEGFQLHKRGETGLALGMAYLGALGGQAVSVLFFVALVVPLAGLAYVFLTPELFALYLLGLVCIVSLTGKSIWKGVVAAAFGLMVGVIGLDPVSIAPRFDFGFRELRNGLDPEPVIIGLLALSELFRQSRQVFRWSEVRVKVSTKFPSLKQIRRVTPSILAGTVTGTLIGAIPGAGGLTGAMIAYQQARVISKHPEEFGHGSIDGIAANEAAQNASNSGELIPTLGLGIPVSGTSVLLLSALTLQGLVPGPRLSTTTPELLDASVAGLIGATILLAVTGWWMGRWMMKVVSINRSAVIVVCIALIFLGVYTLQGTFGVLVCIVFGIIGYFMLRYGYSVAAAGLAAILSGEFERTLRQGLNLTNNSVVEFVTRPLTAGIMLVALAVLILGINNLRRERRRMAALTAKLEETHPDAAILIDPDADPTTEVTELSSATTEAPDGPDHDPSPPVAEHATASSATSDPPAETPPEKGTPGLR
jgi:putative tricarboxylic transport membrane protein